LVRYQPCDDVMFKLRRWFEFLYQRYTRGFDGSELWSLDHTIADFILPRLIAFKDSQVGYPRDLTEKKWDTILDKMIYAFEVKSREYSDNEPTEKDWEKYDEGMALFAKHFGSLWI